ncbi:hypothetical protein TL16_g05581 [Triparma laevis f. inornata]|uniref:Uncharacterized protein n=1 Tax=Triparma laevis f. inornata TaxID=1714386 RepID=A0A9W7ANS7_9STRA|nr:hypothetical protein TL16_g05581 [Triparma laevis f. inornata]
MSLDIKRKFSGVKEGADATGNAANNDALQKAEALAKSLAKASAELQEVSKMLDEEKLAKSRLEKDKKSALAQLRAEKQKSMKLEEEIDATGSDAVEKHLETLKIVEEEKRELMASVDELKATCDEQQTELEELKDNGVVDSDRQKEIDELHKKLAGLKSEHGIALEDLNHKQWREVDKLKVKQDKEISRLEKKARENPAQAVRIKELEEEIRIQRSKNIESGNKLVAAKWKSLQEKSTLERK